MNHRIRTALRALVRTLDRYSALHFNAPLTHELVRGSAPVAAR